MKKNKISNKTIALFAAAMMLLAGGAFSGTQAVLNIFSPEHFLEFKTDHQFVEIQEKIGGEWVSTDTLLTALDGKILPGKENAEEIRAINTTPDAPQFVRIVIRKYWGIKDDKGNITKVSAFGDTVDGKEVTTPDPAKIELGMSGSSKWQRNPKESTTEREVYYYTDIVPPVDGVTDALTSTLTVNNSVALKPTISDPDPETGIITYTYDYDGYCVCLEAEAQSIQTHNVTGTKPGELNAIKSIWGVDNVTSDGKTLKVN